MQAWAPEEDMIILQCHANLGPKWQAIVQRLPGRTVASVRNRWQRIEKGRKLREAGQPSRNKCQRCKQDKRGHICFAKFTAPPVVQYDGVQMQVSQPMHMEQGTPMQPVHAANGMPQMTDMHMHAAPAPFYTQSSSTAYAHQSTYAQSPAGFAQVPSANYAQSSTNYAQSLSSNYAPPAHMTQGVPLTQQQAAWQVPPPAVPLEPLRATVVQPGQQMLPPKMSMAQTTPTHYASKAQPPPTPIKEYAEERSSQYAQMRSSQCAEERSGQCAEERSGQYTEESNSHADASCFNDLAPAVAPPPLELESGLDLGKLSEEFPFFNLDATLDAFLPWQQGSERCPKQLHLNGSFGSSQLIRADSKVIRTDSFNKLTDAIDESFALSSKGMASPCALLQQDSPGTFASKSIRNFVCA